MMSYHEEEQVSLRRRGSKQAIALAMQGRWKEAIAANKNLIESFPNDVDAYNRLGRAYMELGEYSRAREAYSRTLELDSYNAIAKKNLHRLSHLGDSMAGSGVDFHKVEPQHFIEEIGKAGVVNLNRLAPREVLAKMVAGDKVYLNIDGSNLIAQDGHGEYLGQVGGKHGQRIIKLMEGGNKYTAAVISSAEETMTIIIREVYQAPDQVGQLSFPSKGFERIRPYVGDRIFRRKLENEEEVMEEPGYTIVGGDEVELLPVESPDIDDKADNEE
ncbi:tetratricopeptide repeat protein [Chloroflexota bacterium]